MDIDHPRLKAQLDFLAEADRLKSVLRASRLIDNSRRENSGEHSWHVTLHALILAEHAPAGVDINRVIRMMLIHDLVEIDTGDVPIHATTGNLHGSAEVAAEEAAAAERIFGLLPPDQAAEYRALWDEFEAAATADAIFAKAIDRVQPVMQNLAGDGGTWIDYDVSRERLETRVGSQVMRGAAPIWQHLRSRIDAWFAGRPKSD